MRQYTLNQAISALKIYYSVPLQVPFRQFRNGLIYFAVGFGAMMMAIVYMTPSPQQEWIVLLGLLLGSVGFILAILAQTRLLIGRLYRFFAPQTTKTNKRLKSTS